MSEKGVLLDNIGAKFTEKIVLLVNIGAKFTEKIILLANFVILLIDFAPLLVNKMVLFTIRVKDLVINATKKEDLTLILTIYT